MTKKFIVDQKKIWIKRYQKNPFNKKNKNKFIIKKIFKLTPDVGNTFHYIKYITAKPSFFEKIQLLFKMKKNKKIFFLSKQEKKNKSEILN